MSKRSKISIVLSSMFMLGQLSTPLASLAKVPSQVRLGCQNSNDSLLRIAHKIERYNETKTIYRVMAEEATVLSPYVRELGNTEEANEQLIPVVTEAFEKIFAENKLLKDFCYNILGIGSNNNGQIVKYSLNDHPEIYQITEKIKPVFSKVKNLPSVAKILDKASEGFAANEAYFLVAKDEPLEPGQSYGPMCCWDASHAALNAYIKFMSKRPEISDERVMAGYAGTPLTVDASGTLPHSFTYIYFAKSDVLIFVDPLLDVKFFVPLFLCKNDDERSNMMSEACRLLDARLDKASTVATERVWRTKTNWFFDFLRFIFKNFIAVVQWFKGKAVSLFDWIFGIKYSSGKTPDVRISQSIMVDGSLDPVWKNNNFGELYWANAKDFPTLVKNDDLNNRNAFSKSWVIR